MATTIQIRNVPDALHRALESRATLWGMSLSDYLLAELRLIAEVPIKEQMRARIAALPRIKVSESAADAVRAERDSR